MIVPVILAGGTGTRLFPLSTENLPKQFLNFKNKTLLHHTIDRFSGELFRGTGWEEPVVVTNASFSYLIKKQNLSPSIQILFEHFPEGTANAVAAAAILNKNKTLLITPADHYIQNSYRLTSRFQEALKITQNGGFVMFGVPPTDLNTGFGYIQGERGNACPHPIKSFHEKPDRITCNDYLATGQYFWNTGIYMVQTNKLLEMLPEDVVKAAEKACATGQGNRSNKNFYLSHVPETPRNISLESAVLQKAENLWVVPVTGAGWTDVGTFSSLHEISEKDCNGNSVSGEEIQLLNTHNSYIHTTNTPVSVLGLQNIGVICTQHHVLVMDLKKSQDVKELVEKLKTKEEKEFISEKLSESDRFRVNKLTLTGKAVTSFTKNEHQWKQFTVVKGVAVIQRGGDRTYYSEGQTVEIPAGVSFLLENQLTSELILIEIQTGYIEQ